MSLFLERAMSNTLRRKKSSGDKPKKSLRPDIQGLRTFAVVAVILDHLLGWPSGGFVGVDIFFVISGFLITGLLLREQERTGTISFLGFYRRRAKRILPASLLVLGVTVAAAFLVFGSARFISTAWDALAAALFAGNWRFAMLGTDYFQADGPVSPLQHYWSLAVEEQFYFVWPWVMLLVFWLLAKMGRSGAARKGAGVAIVAISVLSFAWALWESRNNTGFAYFSTFSRSWELGLGALIAVIAPALTRIPSALRPVLAWAGIAGMTASLFVVESGNLFPAPFAALPVLSAALVIIAGTGVSEQKFIWPLTNRVSGYVGDISFSLYLWHFPVIIIGSQLVDPAEPWGLAVIAATFTLLSVYSYHLVEDPIRRSSWLDTKPHRHHRQKKQLSEGYKLTALSALAVATAMVVVPLITQTRQEGAVVAASTTPSSEGANAADVEKLPPEEAKLQASLRTALTAPAWPDLSPTMDEAIAGGQAPGDIGACAEPANLVDEAACTFGDPQATKTAYIVGDSISATYTETIRAALGDSLGWRVKAYGTFGCFFGDVKGADANAECDARRESAIAAINADSPDLVFVSNHYEGRTVAGVGKLSDQARMDSVAASVSRFQKAAGKVVFLAPPPQDISIEECYTKLSKPADCVSKVIPQFTSTRTVEQNYAKRIGAVYFDTERWFCYQGRCPSFAGKVPVKHDRMHMSPAYQAVVAPAFREKMEAQGLL